jgi:hypothetical protein
MATTSIHLSSMRPTLSGLLKRRLVTAGSATLAILSRLSTEHSRAIAAAQHYHELRCSGPLVSRSVRVGSIPRTIFEEFYSGRATMKATGVSRFSYHSEVQQVAQDAAG